MSDSFGHRLRLDQIRDGERLDLVADDEERHAISRRFALESLERLEAHVVLTKTGQVVRADGRLAACVGQSCVVSGEPVSSHVDEPFSVQFVREPTQGDHDEEIELGEADCDTVFYDGASIDLGSAIADTLALSLDPYPRSAGAEAALREAGVLSEDQAGPFAMLTQLKRGDSNQP